jgi:hypothetical protein
MLASLVIFRFEPRNCGKQRYFSYKSCSPGESDCFTPLLVRRMIDSPNFPAAQMGIQASILAAIPLAGALLWIRRQAGKV